jgi:hypothetical protein
VPVRDRWYLAAAMGFPLITITAYLLWLWPRPRGATVVAEVGPYLVSLLTGVPFVWVLSRGPRRSWRLLAFLVAGFVLLWLRSGGAVWRAGGVLVKGSPRR